jgi:two-component system, chemotaxis family, protein-glutamate methylesterase/glutaminase
VIRLLLVEDSAVQREFLRFILEDAGEFEIVGTAADGEEAVEQAGRLHPDVILMDCHMPKLDGIGATRVIMQTSPVPIVIATASEVSGDAQFSFDAIKNGALAVVNKPPGYGTPDHDRLAAQLVRTLRLMSEVPVVRRWPERTDAVPARQAARAARPVQVIAVAGSTGAPAAIAELLGGIASRTDASLLIVQHMTEGFLAGFALWLAARTGMSVQLAADGVLMKPGCAYVAPDGVQMGVDASGRIRFATSADDEEFRPSGNYLLRSVARAFGSRAMGIVLTGMGRDGASGLLEIRHAGGITVAQNEESSVVFGMPAEAIRLGAAIHVLAPNEIAELIRSSTNPGPANA